MCVQAFDQILGLFFKKKRKGKKKRIPLLIFFFVGEGMKRMEKAKMINKQLFALVSLAHSSFRMAELSTCVSLPRHLVHF